MIASPSLLRVVLVTSVVARHDAISGSFLDLLATLRAEDGFTVTGLAHAADTTAPGLRCIADVAGLLTDDDFCAADVIIYEFGVWYEGFNALLIGNGHGRQVVRFHNITPSGLVPPRLRLPVVRSFEHLHNIGRADEIWAVSLENMRIAIEYGAVPERVVHLPLSVRPRVLGRLADKSRAPLVILFIGRFVPSKGVHELIEACRLLRTFGAPQFEVVLAGNETYSDPAYMSRLRTLVATEDNVVRLCGTVDDGTLANLLRRAHILALPSYHEGFGKSVIEGLAAGCVPVGYASAALPHVVSGFGRLVEPGDVSELAQALGAVLDTLDAGDTPLPLDRGAIPVAVFDTLAADYAAEFSPAKIGARIVARLRALAPASQTLPADSAALMSSSPSTTRL
ncbi:glycosyltransferase family 4 protein [Acidiphilium sp.]|uniref:glycosyltransferase family 4 protein n=1 Tax=Acidiphilium sp. TaxID=527 RepID=UPI003D04B03C